MVTIGANLDVAAWASYVREDLSGSLNPRNAIALPARIRQFHYAGGNDHVVPPSVTASALHGAPETLIVVDGFDHICCWTAIWPAILTRLDSDGNTGGPPFP